VLSVAIAAAIVYGAVRILAEAVDILLEAVPKHLDPADILHHLEQADGVQAVHDLHLWTISSGLYALSAHLVVGGCDIRDCDALLTRVKDDLNTSFGINHTTLQLESDAYEHREEIH
jgi:cobalt-zinc-cadmium efflux system protein